MAYGLPYSHVTDDVMWPWKVKLVTPIRLERNISKATWARDFKFGICSYCIGNADRSSAQIIFPESGLGLCHVTDVTLQLLVYDRTYLQNYFELVTSNLVSGLIDCRVLHGLLWGSTVSYPSDSLAFFSKLGLTVLTEEDSDDIFRKFQSLQYYLLAFQNYNYLNLNVHFSKWTSSLIKLRFWLKNNLADI